MTGWLISVGGAKAAEEYLQYSFAYTSGSVRSRGGGLVFNERYPSHPAFPARGNGGTYSPDIPARTRFADGRGSLFLSTGSLSAKLNLDPNRVDFLTFTEIVGLGGFTMEVWIKGGGNEGTIMTSSGAFSLQATKTGVRWISGFDQDTFVSSSFNKKEWHHVAGILENPVMAGTDLQGDLVLYVDGEFKGRWNGARWGKDVQSAFCLGDHPLSYIMESWSGQIYEPRVSLGVRTPDEFMCYPPAVSPSTQPPASVVERVPGIMEAGEDLQTARTVAWITSTMSGLCVMAACYAFRGRKIALDELNTALSRLNAIARKDPTE